MALLFMDSFDHYVTADLPAKWNTIANSAGGTSLAVNAATGRHSSASLRVHFDDTDEAVGVAKTLSPTGSVAVIGVAVQCATFGGAAYLGVVQVLDGASAQLSVAVLPSGVLRVTRGGPNGTVLGTTSATIPAGSYTYLEVRVTISPTVGTVDVRTNGGSVLSLTAQNTSNTGSTTWTGVVLGQTTGLTFNGTYGATVDYDDLYVLDGSGAAPWNTFLGDCRVDARVPTGAGATTGWTPSAGANWAAVDDAAPNGDTDYVAATAVATDTYVTQDAPVVGATIYGVQHCINLKKMDAGVCTVAPVIRHSGVDYPGADISPSTSYAYGLQVAQVNPGTAAQWTEAGFNAAEFGIKRTS